jgi:hypothetical protein
MARIYPPAPASAEISQRSCEPLVRDSLDVVRHWRDANRRCVFNRRSGRWATQQNCSLPIVQARVSATQFAAGTGSRWFGVLARYTDARNYYYVTLRSDNTIALRKLVNGAIHVLDSAPLTSLLERPT